MIDRTNSAIRKILIKHCYEYAGEDPIQSDACDLFEQDVIKLLWNVLDFRKLIKYNKQKYTFVIEKMPSKIFKHMVRLLKPLKEELEELLDEMEAHRDVAILKIKQHVNNRTKTIMEMHDFDSSNPAPRIRNYEINVTQTIGNRSVVPWEMEVPRPLRLDGSTDLFNGSGGYEEISKPSDKGLYRGSRNYSKPWDSAKHKNHSKLDKDHKRYFENSEFQSNNNESESENEGDHEFKGSSRYDEEVQEDLYSPEHYSEDIPGHFYNGFNPEQSISKKRHLRVVYHNRHLI